PRAAPPGAGVGVCGGGPGGRRRTVTGTGPIDVAGLSRAERDQMLRRAYETQGLSIRGLARAAGLAYTTVADALKRADAKRAALDPRAVAIAVACGADDAEL